MFHYQAGLCRHPSRAAVATRPGPAAVILIFLLCGSTSATVARARVVSDRPVSSRHPSVLLIGIDTMRGDHLGCAGDDSIETPNLDGLAHEGVLFTAAHAAAPWTLPSFATVFTGLWPSHHGAVGGTHAWLDSRMTTMAEIFSAAGYAVEGVAGIDWLTRQCNMDQGFQPGSGPMPPEGLDRTKTHTWLAGDFFARMRSRPAFFFLHYFSVHAPYTPPPPYDGMYYHGDARAPGEPILTMLLSSSNRAPNREDGMYDFLAGVTDLAYPITQYAAGVTYVDAQIGVLMARLKELGVYDDMLIVVLADHGEHLGEHGIWFTHLLPYEETLHVPLIIKLPRGRHAGTVVDEPVSLVDVLPTVLDETGLSARTALDGRDLGPLMAGRDTGRSVIAAEQGADPRHDCRTLQEGRWKLLVFRDDAASRCELYDLAVDPAERHDSASERPGIVARLRRKMEALWPDGWDATTGSAPELPAIDNAARRRLKSLGY